MTHNLYIAQTKKCTLPNARTIGFIRVRTLRYVCFRPPWSYKSSDRVSKQYSLQAQTTVEREGVHFEKRCQHSVFDKISKAEERSSIRQTTCRRNYIFPCVDRVFFTYFALHVDSAKLSRLRVEKTHGLSRVQLCPGSPGRICPCSAGRIYPQSTGRGCPLPAPTTA